MHMLSIMRSGTLTFQPQKHQTTSHPPDPFVNYNLPNLIHLKQLNKSDLL